MCQHAMHGSWHLEDPDPMQVSWSGVHLHAGTLLRRTPAHRPCHPRAHCPFRALWTLSHECPTAHEGPHLGPSTAHRPCPRHTCSARATSASSSGISSSSASGPTWEPRQTLRIWRTVPGALRPDHLQAHGSGAWLRGMCTLSTSTVGVSYSISGTYICNHRDTGSISNPTILLFYDFKGSILNFLNSSILFCCFLREP